MVHKFKGGVIVDGTLIANGLRTSPTASVVATEKGSVLHRSVMTLSSKAVTVLGANDYGSAKLCDLPNSQLLIVGVIVDLTATGTGGVNTIANVDLAIGTVATTTTAFSNAGEKNLCPKIDCTSGGVIKGSSTSTETNVTIAEGASNAIYVNIGDVISSDGTVVLSGNITILYFDLGAHG